MARKPGELFHQSIKIEPQNVITVPYDRLIEAGVYIPYEWHIMALKYGKNIRFIVYCAPGGCGKTVLAILISMDEIVKSNNSRKHIFLAPTIEISENFCETKKIYFNNRTITWEVLNKYRFNSENTESIKGLREFLLSEPGNFEYHKNHFVGPYATATHLGMVMTWEKLTEDEKKIALRNITIHIDECHHSKSNTLDPTHLGKFVTDICDINEPTCSVNMFTATYFRTDKGHILPLSFDDKFEKWNIPLQQYLSIINIKYFNFRFLHYEKDPLDQIIKYMKKHKRERHVVILPKLKNRFRNKGTLKRYLKEIHKVFDPSRVLDLVTQRTQKKNRRLLRENKTAYNVVIACDIFNEGYDWPPASVLHNTAFGVSQGKFAQIMYRIFRPFNGKDKIWLYIYIPPLKDATNIREIYSDRLNLFLLSIIMSELCANIKIPLISTAPFYHDKKGSTSLHEIMDYKEYTKLMEVIAITYDEMENKEDPEELRILLDVIAEYFYKKDIKEHLDYDNFLSSIKTIFIKQLRISRNKSIGHISIEYIREQGFDKIWKMENTGSIIYGTKKPLTQKELFQLEKIMRKGLLTKLKQFSRKVQERKSQDHIIKRVPLTAPPKVIKNLKNEWVHFEVPAETKIPSTIKKIFSEDQYSSHARVLVQTGFNLEIAIYKGDIKIVDEKIILTTKEIFKKDKPEEFIFCDNYWRSVFMPPTVTPFTASSYIANKRFLYEGNVSKGRKRAPYITAKIPYDWVKYTL